MRVVIDTSVVVSAVWRDRLPEATLLCVLHQPEMEWVASTDILTEYASVLARPKFGLSPTTLQHWLQVIRETVVLVDVLPELSFPRDQKDAKFLACALSAQADYVITGGKDFTEARTVIATTVVSVRQFHQQFCAPPS